jgi:hypothetical protein
LRLVSGDKSQLKIVALPLECLAGVEGVVGGGGLSSVLNISPFWNIINLYNTEKIDLGVFAM